MKNKIKPVSVYFEGKLVTSIFCESVEQVTLDRIAFILNGEEVASFSLDYSYSYHYCEFDINFATDNEIAEYIEVLSEN